MFPGQGSQYVYMGQELYRTEPSFRDEVDRCAEILITPLGLDIRTVLYPPAEREEWAKQQLAATALSQPALFVIEYALARLWMSWGVVPSVLVGHSVGEFAAAVLAEVMSLEDALGLIAERARLMQSMTPGSMLSVRLSEAEVQTLLGGALSLAAINSPRQCVVSGERTAVASFQATLEARGVPCKELQTSHAFHSPMMEPIVAPFRSRVEQVRLRNARLPIVSTSTGKWIDPEEWCEPDYWARQLRDTVRFDNAAAILVGRNDSVLLEVGPGRSLASQVLQQPGRRKEQLVLASLSATGETAAVLGALGQVWTAGVDVKWRARRPESFRRVALPGYPFDRERHWLDAPASITSQHVDRAPTVLSGNHSSLVEEVIQRQLAMMRLQLETLNLSE